MASKSRAPHNRETSASAAYSKKKNCEEKKPIIELWFQKRHFSSPGVHAWGMKWREFLSPIYGAFAKTG